MKAKKPEAALLDQVRAYLRLRGLLVIRINGMAMSVGKRYIRSTDTDGVSDLLLCVQGRMVAIELKVKTKLTLSQSAFLDRVRQAGGVGFVARSLAEVIDGLTKEGLL